MSDTPSSPPLPPAWSPAPPGRPLPARVLLVMVLIIATAGLVYELAMASVASYVLGDSVTQFSLVIGVYLSALGLGAYLSRYIERQLSLRFVDVELSTALMGGVSAPGLFLAYAHTSAFQVILYAAVLLVGTLVGLELPLLMRILRREYEFKELVAKALTFDYAGALIGSVAFSLLLVPKLGLVNSSLLCGLLNGAVGLASTWVLSGEDERERRALGGARVRGVIVCVLLALGLLQSERVTELSETAIYGGRVSLAVQSRYQRIVLVERGEGFEMYLNGNLQFASRDEHRYHEALVHPALATAARRERVLIGGGGDGLALREVLRWPSVRAVTLVDLDPKMTELALNHPQLRAANHNAMADPRVTVVNADAMVFFREHQASYDVVILDFPDPSNFSLGKLYSTEFYRQTRARLAPGGVLVVQATSPLFARKAFWCIDATLRATGFSVVPYRTFVPSFGEWGYLLARTERFSPATHVPIQGLTFLDDQVLAALFQLPPDLARVQARENRLDNQILVAYYLEEWERWN